MRRNQGNKVHNGDSEWFSSWIIAYAEKALKGKFHLERIMAYHDGKAQMIAKGLEHGETVTVLAALSGNLAYEHLVLSQFHRIEDDWGLPKLLYFEQGPFSDVLVTSYCGDCLEVYPSPLESDLHSTSSSCILQCTKVFFQLVYVLQTLHNLNIVHGNISPSNVCFNKGRGTLSLTNFSKSRFLKTPKFGNTDMVWWKDPVQPSHLDATYAPRMAVQSKTPVFLNYRDDLESAFYVLLHLCKKTLPRGAELSKEIPLEFVDLYTYITSLADSDIPDFGQIRKLVLRSMLKLEKGR